MIVLVPTQCHAVRGEPSIAIAFVFEVLTCPIVDSRSRRERFRACIYGLGPVLLCAEVNYQVYLPCVQQEVLWIYVRFVDMYEVDSTCLAGLEIVQVARHVLTLVSYSPLIARMFTTVL